MALAAIVKSNDKLSARVWTILKLMKFLSLLFGAMLFVSVLAVAITNEQPHQRPRHELGQRLCFGADESNDIANQRDWRGIFPVGAALLARHRGIREHLNPN